MPVVKLAAQWELSSEGMGANAGNPMAGEDTTQHEGGISECSPMRSDVCSDLLKKQNVTELDNSFEFEI